MNLKQYICLASLFLPIGTTAQTSNNHIICDFESEDSYTQVGENQWFDAVFPISGNPGAELHKLLVVPDLQSPHNRTSDFLFYIDDIELSTSATPRFSTTYYDINYEKTQKLNRTDRHLNSITLKADGKTQTLKVGQQSTKMLYMPMLEQAFTAKPGQTITATFNYQGTWMSGYVFLDRDNDGQFNVVTDGDNITNDRDLMAYSFFKGKDSSGKTQPDGNRLNPPAFTLPSDLKPGVYRMRFKVDWDNVEPGGSLTQDNSILSNGGAIVDVRLVVHNDQVTIKRGTRGTSGGLNGDVLKADGSKLTEELIPFGEPYNVSVKPAPGFKFSHFLIRHGNISSEDSLLYETPQFFDATLPATMMMAMASPMARPTPRTTAVATPLLAAGRDTRK